MTKRVLVLLIVLGILSGGSVSRASDDWMRLEDFVTQIYLDYAGESFATVYAAMYPTIKERVSEQDYVEFQRGHFEDLSLEITEIEVGEIREEPRLIRSLRQLLPDDEDRQVFGVEIRYKASFVRGTRYKQRITKTVYVVAVNWCTERESLYLLWDPSSMEEEGTDQ